MRLFQNSGNLLADEMEVYGTSIDDINKEAFSGYFKKEFGQTFEEKGLTYEEALRAKRVLRNGQISLAGLLFFTGVTSCEDRFEEANTNPNKP